MGECDSIWNVEIQEFEPPGSGAEEKSYAVEREERTFITSDFEILGFSWTDLGARLFTFRLQKLLTGVPESE